MQIEKLFKNFISKDKTRESLCRVWTDGVRYAGTDGHKLLVVGPDARKWKREEAKPIFGYGDYEYPDITQVIPHHWRDEFIMRVVVKVDHLCRAAEAASLLVRDKNPCIRLSFSSGGMRIDIESSSPEIGEAKVSITAVEAYNAVECSQVGLNAKYIINVCDVWKQLGLAQIEMKLFGALPGKPTLSSVEFCATFREEKHSPENEVLAVVMPMRL